MNSVCLVGRLTRDPELRTLSTGKCNCNFSIAVDRQFSNANGEREADFINCVVWDKQAENLAKYCSKGTQIAVTGRIQTRNYDGTDGKKVYVTEVVANNITFLGSKNSNNNNNTNNYGTEPSFEDIPNYNVNSNSNSFESSNDLTEDPFKEYGSEVVLNDEDLPF